MNQWHRLCAVLFIGALLVSCSKEATKSPDVQDREFIEAVLSHDKQKSGEAWRTFERQYAMPDAQDRLKKQYHDQIASSVQDSDPSVRIRARDLLCKFVTRDRFGTPTAECYTAIVNGLFDPDEKVRHTAIARGQSTMDFPRTLDDRLFEALKSDDPQVVFFAERHLHLDDKGVQEKLKALSESTSPRERYAATLGLFYNQWGQKNPQATLTDKDADVIADALMNADPDTRSRFVEMLRPYGQDARGIVIPLLERAALDQDPHIAKAAQSALDPMKPTPVEIPLGMTDSLKSADDRQRVTILTSLGWAGPAAAASVPSLQSWTRNRNPDVRTAAKKAVRQIQSSLL